MWRLRVLAARLLGCFRPSGSDRELNGEIADHLRLLTERFVRQGLSREEAGYAARRQFGGIAQLQEERRSARGMPAVEGLVRDIGFGLRMIRRRPGFSLALIAVLALVLGANTAIFSLVNGVLLRPLPFANPERLVALFERDVAGTRNSYNAVAPANFLDWQKQAATLERIAGISYARLNLSGGSESSAPERIDACACSASLFETLGTAPFMGRAFRPEEDRPGAPRVVVIGYRLWKRRFNGSPSALAATIRLDSQPYTVIGVMPRSFSYPSRTTEAWIPIQNWLPAVVLQAHDNHLLTVIGRLRPGATAAQANAEIDSLVRGYKSRNPGAAAAEGGTVVPVAELGIAGVRRLLLLLLGAVGCVLLIACVNVANLLLSQGSGRRREVAIRAALGAGRGRIVRQLLMEIVTLSFLGGLAGLLLAYGLIGYLAAWLPDSPWLPQAASIRLDPAVFLFSLGVALGTGLIAGLFPALRASRPLDAAHDLKEGGRSNTAGRSLHRFREFLVASEVALSLVLVVAAGLLIRSSIRLAYTNLGLRTENRIVMRVSLPDARYHERAQVAGLLRELTFRVQSIPGVIGAGFTSCPAVTLPGFCPDSLFEIEHQPSPPDRRMDAQYRGVDPGFFRAAGIPILRGRAFTASDGIGVDDKHPLTGATIISQALSRKYFPTGDPIGHVLTLKWFVGNNPERSVLRYRIVGISGDVLERPQSPPQPTFYLPLLDGDSTDISIVLHTGVDSRAAADQVRAAIRAADPDLPVFGIQSMSASVGETTRDHTFVVTLLTLFAALAFVLAAVGLYGVVSWGVSQRLHEIAIRMALGATRAQVHGMVLLNGVRPALLGIVVGLPLAASVSGLLEGLLFEVRPLDPITFAIASLMLLTVTVAACLIPAIRAAGLEPTIGLRAE